MKNICNTLLIIILFSSAQFPAFSQENVTQDDRKRLRNEWEQIGSVLSTETWKKYEELLSVARIAHHVSPIPEDVRRDAEKQFLDLKNELFKNESQTVQELLAVFQFDARTNSEKVSVINFMRVTGIGKEEVFPVVRSIIEEAEAKEQPDDLVGQAALYLSDLGSESDISLLQRLITHSNPAIALSAKHGIDRIKSRSEMKDSGGPIYGWRGCSNWSRHHFEAEKEPKNVVGVSEVR